MSLLAAVFASMSGVTIDTTLDAVNWANIGPTFSPGENANQTLSGINTTIQLSAANSGGATLAYSLNGAAFANYTVPFSVSNGDTLRWQVTGSATGTVTVTNDNDGPTVIDTFTYDVI